MSKQFQVTKEHVLERVTFGFSRRFPDREAPVLDTSVLMLREAEHVGFQLYAHIYCSKPNRLREEVRAPETWFDHWLTATRGRWFAWFWRKRPIRYKVHVFEVDERAAYPELRGTGPTLRIYDNSRTSAYRIAVEP